MTGPSTQTSALVNDTLIGSGTGSYGVLVLATGGFTTTLKMTNSIARGAGADVYMDAGPTSASTAIFNADHSNYGSLGNAMAGGTVTPTLPGSGSNQMLAPAFVDAAAGNFRELGSSPTVDAGIASALSGATDLDGNPRQVGPRADIGAYEFIPVPTCSSASTSTPFETAKVIQLSCHDAVGSLVLYAIATQPAHGTVALNASSGSATYTPAPGFSGTDSFTYTGMNGHGTSTATTVSIAVGQEPAPVISTFARKGRRFSFTLNEPATVTMTIARKGHRARALSRQGTAGANTITLAHRLKRGRYTVTLSATNAGGTAHARPLTFTIKARHRPRRR
jgi:hypothetical protein